MGALDCISVSSAASSLMVKADSFFGQGAYLFAHATFNTISPWNTALSVDDGYADYPALFLFQR